MVDLFTRTLSCSGSGMVGLFTWRFQVAKGLPITVIRGSLPALSMLKSSTSPLGLDSWISSAAPCKSTFSQFTFSHCAFTHTLRSEGRAPSVLGAHTSKLGGNTASVKERLSSWLGLVSRGCRKACHSLEYSCCRLRMR